MSKKTKPYRSGRVLPDLTKKDWSVKIPAHKRKKTPKGYSTYSSMYGGMKSTGEVVSGGLPSLGKRR